MGPAEKTSPDDTLRRGLLALTSALVVARPLVPGEDPGLVLFSSRPAGLILLMLWLIAAASWAGWFLWSKSASWPGGGVEAGLMALAAIFFVSAEQASYLHAAWLAAWEWLGLFLAFLLVRQLVRTPAEGRGFLAVVLATGVAVSGQSLYQQVQQLAAPAARTELPAGDAMVWLSGTVAAPDTAFAPFTLADSLAGYLLLLLPALFLGVWVCRRGSSPLWRMALVLVCALVTTAALVFALYSTVRDRSFRFPVWLGTGKLIEDHPWLGVGPAQFHHFVSRFLPSRTPLDLTTPHNLFLEITVTGGLLALVAFLATLVLFLRRLKIKPLPLKSKSPKLTGDEPRTNDQAPRTPWEYYLGGMVGLLIGFLLQALGRHPEMVIHLALLAGARSIVWFAAFALLDGIPWQDSIRSLATGLGLGVLLVFWTVAGNVSFPSVAQSFWVLAALTLNALPSAACLGWKVPWYARVAALPFLVAVGCVFFLTTLQPVVSSASAARRALLAGRLYLDDRGKPLPDKHIQRPKDFLEKNILQPLEEAARLDGGSTPQDVQSGQRDGGDARLHLYLAYWYAKHWELDPIKQEALTLAIWHAGQVWHVIDPQGRDGYLAEYHLRTLLARKSQPVKAKRQYELAADVLTKLLSKAPSDPCLRFLLADALFRAEKKEEGQRQARAARELNANSLPANLRLSEKQEEQVREWLEPTK